MIDIELLGAPALLAKVEPCGNIRYLGLNIDLQQMLGVEADQLVGKTPAEALPPARAQQAMENFTACLTTGKIATFVEEVDLPAGKSFLRVTLTPLRSPHTVDIAYIIGICADVTEAIEEKRKLREANTRLQLALDAVDGAFWHIDVPSGEFTASDGLARIAGSSSNQGFCGEDWMNLIKPTDTDAASVEPLLSGEVSSMISYYRIEDKAGDMRWMKCRRKTVVDDKGQVAAVCGVTVDITHEKIKETELERKARTDSLTGLGNFAQFKEKSKKLDQKIRQNGGTYSVIIVDLNDFKPINDTHGHIVGDAVLREFGNRLRAAARKTDTVCRIGGDEFAVLLPNSTLQDAEKTTERLQDILATPVPGIDAEVWISASTGCTEFDPEQSLDVLLQEADDKMYQAKGNRRRNQLSNLKKSA